MAPFAIVFTIIATYFCFANGRVDTVDGDSFIFPGDDMRVRRTKTNTIQKSACSGPSGSGTCKSLYECPELLELVRKPDKTLEDLDLLKKSQCGFQGSTPKVCCPNPCYTPDGQPGKCISIYGCAHLANMLKPPVSKENMQYVQNSKCTGPSQYSVCCGPPRNTNVVVPEGNCAATVSAFPPNPSTECCGVDSRVGNKIVGGNATTVDQFPWLVIIEYIQQGKIKLLCGGALISGRYVLTAAHCVTGDVLKVGTPKNVRLGEYDTKNDGQDCAPVEAGGMDCTDGMIIVPIEQIVPHPDYSTSRKQSPNDIALIRLRQNAPFTDFIRPICLPTSDVTLNPPQNLNLYTAGWGAVSTTQPSSNVKLFVDLPYVGKSLCEPAYKSGGRNLQLTSGQMCAGGIAGKDSCRGDSGGPLMFENGRTYEIVGVVSFGPTPCGLPNVPGVYTKVYEYNNWIRSTIYA